VVRALDLKRDDSRNPIFQIMFSFHEAPLTEPGLSGVRLKCVEVIGNQSAKFDLNVIVIARREQNPVERADEDSITMIWEHSSDLFEPDTIERMAGQFVAPRNNVEATLADIWAEVLKLEKVGIRDNFFYLGGHSLLATQIISRILNAFSVEVPLG
jgi:hypothetical protein